MNKIFLGTTDIAGQLTDFKKGYESLGYSTFIFTYEKNDLFRDNEYSFVLHDIVPKVIQKHRILKKVFTLLVMIPVKYAVFLWAAMTCDIFHLMWFLEKENSLYFKLLKLLNKKIIISFVGSDVRWMPLWIQEFRLRNLSLPNVTLLMENTIRQKSRIGGKLQYVRTCERYADMILSVPEQGQLQLRPYYNFLLPVDLKHIRFNAPDSVRTVVSVGVTEPNFKNSSFVIDTINEFKIRKQHSFDLIIIENKTHAESLELLSKSDIFVYSPFVSGPGKFGIEALAAGAVLLTGYEEDFYNMPEHPPLVKTTPGDFIEKLDYYITHAEERKKLAMSGRQWVEKYGNIDWICEDILIKLANKNISPEYFPGFFRNHASVTSQWDETDAVKICNHNITPGQREGLNF